MEQEKTYVKILVQSLQRKEQLLSQLLELTQQQEAILVQPVFQEDRFNEIMEQKAVLIQNLSDADQGFEQLYGRVSDALTNKKAEYRDEIKKMQEMIPSLMDLSAKIQSLELKNKDKVASYVHKEREKIKDYNVNSRMAANYYKAMSKHSQGDSYFLDKKS